MEKDSHEFVPPRHWLGPEELEASYWADPQVREKRAQEFFEKPVELIELIDRTDQQGIARRDFLTIMGASMAMATFACARKPVNKIIPHVVKPEEITPGVAAYYASTCKECSVACGILTRNREGRPIKIEGNPDHPLSRGALCAHGQASVLNLYDNDRLKAPLALDRASGASHEVSWTDADAAILAKLKKAGRVRVLTGAMTSPSTTRLIREFLGGFRDGQHVQYEPLALDEIQAGQEASYGTAVVPHYRFDGADVVLSLGADFLGNWVSPVEHAAAWVKKRKLNGKNAKNETLSKFYCFESTMTITGGNADERFAVRPGDELKVALSIAHVLIDHKKLTRFANDAAVKAVLADYHPENVAKEIGLPGGAAKIEEIAENLWRARGKSLVVAGGIHSKTPNALALQIAVNLLNSALENEGVTVDGTSQTSASAASFKALAKLVGEMKSGSVDVLIVHRSNPAFTAPRAALGLDEAMKKVPLVIAIADREDETGKLADFVLPDHHYLENWGDSNPRRGVHSLQQPTIAPIHSTRAFEDGLIAWSKAMGKASGLIAKSPDWHEYLKSNWQETVYRDSKSAAGYEQFWETSLRDGVIVLNQGGRGSARSFRSASMAQVPKYKTAAESGPVLALYESIAMADGRNANNPWLQELPDPISSITWDNYLNVSTQMAKSLALHENDVVEVKAGDVSVQLPVHVQPGMHPSVVSVAVGYGRRAVGKIGNLAGVDVFPMVRVENGHPVFAGQTVSLRKTGRFYRLAATQNHTVTENRPVINDLTLAQFRKNPGMSNETEPELRMHAIPSIWNKHEYKGYRWGMSIDLNSCTGCAACVVACQSENNIPVVGREQVRNSRQMQWIRIDRYYSGAPENPQILFQPMLCQHCENAPCETVCPVLATVHDDEGLNVQVYNRCVGTRYCQNNCPYKVRRFNFFDHWKSYDGPMNLAWNPDVTVRSRGIMEKCTFCVQRIREAKDRAKDAGAIVQDADLKTACQQTCPTDAIIFGNLNSKDSHVTHLTEDPRAFRALEVLNTRPSLSYLSKVRNVEATHEEHEA